MGRLHNGLIQRGLGHIYMSASLRAELFFFLFLILLTCFNFPGPSARSPLPQQPRESFPFDFSLICAQKKKKNSINQPAGVNVKAGFEFYA